MRDSGPSELNGATALVTGAGQGIGEAVVRALVDAGARVAALDHNGEAVRKLAAELTTQGASVRPWAVDVQDSAAVETAVDEMEREFGELDILANVAGVLPSAAPATETSDEEWAHTFGVNVTGVFHLSRAVSRRMKPRGHGSIVTVASNAAGIPRSGMAAYTASKAAAAMFTKSLGLELAEHGIRCNVVCPGSTDTAMQHALWTDGNGPEKVITGDLAAHRTGIPLGRIADAADIADAVLFLLSDRARHVTMQDLYVDGGATLRA